MVQWMALKSVQFDASVTSSTMKIDKYALITDPSHHTPREDTLGRLGGRTGSS
jgi:hypothetical protein